MKYLFEETELNPVELEKQLGLRRGDIKGLTVYPEGAVEVEAIELSEFIQKKLRDILKAHNLLRGRKIEKEEIWVGQLRTSDHS